MRRGKMKTSLLIILMIGVMLAGATSAAAAEPIELYTALADLVASPGQEINFNIEVINNTDSIQRVGLAVSGVPDGWNYELTSSSRKVKAVLVKAQSSHTVNLSVEVPLAVAKGEYAITVNSDRGVSLPVQITVSEEGTYETVFSTEQPNLEGSSTSSFSYSAELRNKTAETQTYALRHGAERGWDVRFKSGGKDVSSVVVEPNESQTITIDVTPPTEVAAGTYKIPVEAASGSTGGQIDLEAVITGTYKLELTTPTGRLSEKITAGGEKKIDLEVKNTGSVDLRDIQLTASTPVDWEVTFDSKEINLLEAGQSKVVTATISASEKAIAGDYVVSMTARAPEADSSATFRMTVEASVLWGWLGILIVAAVLGGVYALFRKYGRR